MAVDSWHVNFRRSAPTLDSRGLHQTVGVEIDKADLELIIEALEEAAMWHDARSRVIDSAARKSARRFPGRAVEPGAGREEDRQKGRDYAALATRLKGMT